ncbi:ATP-binding protein [Oscillatoriales cyanobacterium LEGE 11467]|uniref:ATP-binding protein n=1 Tax=Zarconia navalis LEGE 11467 TaxID=1828826 RepID=A0A928Z8Y7_9CYAN|nr:ATP-binding protein [Zarconia navalis]MBE9041124.1 ATP-binding protein [Zarconia navalis LEGE 11467]
MKDSSKFPSHHQEVLRVGTDLAALARILSWFDRFEPPHISQRIWLQCKTALAEGFTNAVRHAHKNLPSNVPIDIEVTQSPQSLEIRILDYGPPFNLEEKLKTLPEEIDLEATGGRGLKIMHSIVDRLAYTRIDSDRNCLLMIKDYTQSQSL